MVASVTFDPAKGGDGSTVTDDENPSTGIRRGGHRLRFIPALSNFVSMLSWFVTLISGYPRYRGAGSWAARPLSGNVVGDRYTVTDFGSIWWDACWNGTYWIAITPVDMGTLAPVTLTTSASEQIVFQFSAPPGIQRAFRGMRWSVGLNKLGTVDSSQLRIRAGATGTVSDAQFRLLFNIPTGNQSQNGEYHFQLGTSATQARQLGTNNTTGSVGSNSGSTTNGTSTVPNIDSATTIFSITASRSGSSDTIATAGIQAIFLP